MEPKRALSGVSGMSGAQVGAGSSSEPGELPLTAERLVRDLALTAELNSAACMLQVRGMAPRPRTERRAVRGQSPWEGATPLQPWADSLSLL